MLQNSRVTAFTVLELLRVTWGGGGGGGVKLPPPKIGGKFPFVAPYKIGIIYVKIKYGKVNAS